MQMARRFWQTHARRSLCDTCIRLLHHSGYGLAMGLWLQAVGTVPLLHFGLLDRPAIYAVLVAPGLLFLVGIFGQMAYRYSQGGARAGLLELEAALVALGLSPTIFYRGMLGLMRDGGAFVRTPKGGDRRFHLDQSTAWEIGTVVT